MTTLYEQFNEVRKDKNNWRFKPDIQQKLIDIFKIISDIDLSLESTPFKPDGGSFGMETAYNYTFKYGRVHVQTEKKEMQVMFILDNPYELIVPFSLPSLSNRCSIKVDHDLNFIEGRFGFYISLSNRTLNRYVSGNLILGFERIINSTQSFNRISYSSGTTSNSHINLIQYNLHKNYLIPNYEFEQIFMEFITFCSHNPEEFYNVFIEYPNYEQIISSVDKFVVFLNLLYQQYTDNINLLKSRLLLLHMQKI